jgi:hypothetical protein
MPKEKQLTIKLNALTALDLLQILDSSTFGYSKEYEPERISRLRSLMSQLDQELEKFII